jgi:magnesium chelatase subunit D
VRRARIDVAATLRAAAPWQRLRSTTDHRPPTTGIHPAVVSRQSSVVLRSDDLRVKQFRSKAGALFCFAVDASGSMALHRMRQAKGAVHSLLQQAYIHRDRVALLAFRGQRAELLLPPSQSVELARRALDLLPTGGGTPLAAALLGALEIAAQARGRGIHQTVLVLLTDGRANVGVRAERGGVATELQRLAGQVAAAGIHSLVIDTQRNYLSRGEARQLAGWLGGEYIYLPNASGAQIADAALGARTGDPA